MYRWALLQASCVMLLALSYIKPPRLYSSKLHYFGAKEKAMLRKGEEMESLGIDVDLPK